LDDAEFKDYTASTTGFIPDEEIIKGHQAMSQALQRFIDALKVYSALLITRLSRIFREELRVKLRRQEEHYKKNT
jgi:hypothetical protein